MNLLFDYGGVLVRLDKTHCLHAFAQLGIDVRPFIGTFAQRGVFSDFESGRIDTHGFCDALRRVTAHDELSDAQIIAAWASYLDGVPQERLDLLLKIRQHYTVSLLSNTNPVHWDMARTDYLCRGGHTVSSYFDHVFLSYEMGCEKPEPTIFETVVRDLNCEAADVLFFDDSEENCAAARRCGLQARVAPADGSWMKFFAPSGELLI